MNKNLLFKIHQTVNDEELLKRTTEVTAYAKLDYDQNFQIFIKVFLYFLSD